jgi:hypothetical protein
LLRTKRIVFLCFKLSGEMEKSRPLQEADIFTKVAVKNDIVKKIKYE